MEGSDFSYYFNCSFYRKDTGNIRKRKQNKRKQETDKEKETLKQANNKH